MDTLIATVEPNHTVKVPTSLAVGEQVLIMPVPSITALLNDAARRARFAATRKALQEAVAKNSATVSLTNQEIVSLVKKARRATRPS